MIASSLYLFNFHEFHALANLYLQQCTCQRSSQTYVGVVVVASGPSGTICLFFTHNFDSFYFLNHINILFYNLYLIIHIWSLFRFESAVHVSACSHCFVLSCMLWFCLRGSWFLKCDIWDFLEAWFDGAFFQRGFILFLPGTLDCYQLETTSN